MTFQQWISAHGEAAAVGTFLAVLVACLSAERRWPRAAHDPRRRARWPANGGLAALAIGTMSLLPLSLVTAAAWASERGVGLLHALSFPAAAAVAATLLLRALLSFATHLLMHRVPLLWRVHRVHHLDTALDASTTVRFHPLEMVIGAAFGVPAVVLLGLEPWVLAAYEVLDAAVTVFSHANLRLPRRLERALSFLVVTPGLHRVHHSTWQPETDSNFGAVFPLWDLVFATFRPEPREPLEMMRVGLDDARGPETNRVAWLLAAPFRTLEARSPSTTRLQEDVPCSTDP
jgi:sterol desaturase/sphingolipid hydroxylase (fatty acid hydroxylase superfamily)